MSSLILSVSEPKEFVNGQLTRDYDGVILWFQVYSDLRNRTRENNSAKVFIISEKNERWDKQWDTYLIRKD